MKRLLTVAFLVGLHAVASISGSSPLAGDDGALTIEKLIDIRHPSNAAWSADGRQVTFTWDRAGVSHRYVSNLDGAPPTEIADPAAPVGRGRGGNAQGGR